MAARFSRFRCTSLLLGYLLAAAPVTAAAQTTTGSPARRVVAVAIELSGGGCSLAQSGGLLALGDGTSVQVIDTAKGTRAWGEARTGSVGVAMADGVVWTVDQSAKGNRVVVRRDAKTGRIVGRHRVALSNPSPIGVGSSVVLVDEDGGPGMFGYDRNGKVLWSVRATPRFVVSEDLFLVQAGGSMRFLRVADGQFDGASYPAQAINFSTPDRSTLIGGNFTPQIALVEPGSGDWRWTRQFPQNITVGGVVGDSVFVAYSTGNTTGNAWHALNLQTGKTSWTKTLIGRPFVANGLLYTVSAEGVGAVDPASGALTSFRSARHRVPSLFDGVADFEPDSVAVCGPSAADFSTMYAYVVRRPGS